MQYNTIQYNSITAPIIIGRIVLRKRIIIFPSLNKMQSLSIFSDPASTFCLKFEFQFSNFIIVIADYQFLSSEMDLITTNEFRNELMIDR
jgi:hypothetical protein